MQLQDLFKVIEQYEAELITFRRKLHSEPELAYKEFNTAAAVLARMQSIPGLEVESGIAGTGIRVVLQGGKPGPVVALRADMDALPIIEETGLEYQSKHAGVMHACGHDGHTTCLLGALLVLAELREALHGTVICIFQPAEELEFGALRMVEAGVLKSPAADVIYGLHAWPELPVGSVAAAPGPVFAGFRDFDITIIGSGAHAAMPEKGVDSIVVASQLILALQSVVSRSVAPASQLVVTVGSIAGGKGRNVIPGRVSLSGTTRFYDESVGLKAMQMIEQLAHNIAAGFGASVTIGWIEGAPPVINNTQATDFFIAQAGSLQEGVEFAPVMASEDFSYYLESVPGTFWGLGVRGENSTAYPLHHPKFNFADTAIRYGVAMHCLLALNYHSRDSASC